jgi:hypothetical protein
VPTATRIASISGVFLAPGVSRNNRWYRPEVVRAAVENLRQRIASGGPPVLMATSHAAGRTDDALATAGVVREVWCDENAVARFRADVPGSTAGRDVVANLQTGAGGGVSIDGDWFNVRRMVGPDGRVAEAGDNLVIKRIDLTGDSGVPQARIDQVSVVESVNPSTGAVAVHESVETSLVIEVNETGATDALSQPAPIASIQETQVPNTTDAAAATPVAEGAPAAVAPVELSESAVTAIATAVGTAVAEAMKAAAPAPAAAAAATESAPATETATPLTESAIQTLIADGMKSAVETLKVEMREELKANPAFGFGRMGRVATSESAGAEKSAEDLAKMTPQELRAEFARDEAAPMLAQYGIEVPAAG